MIFFKGAKVFISVEGKGQWMRSDLLIQGKVIQRIGEYLKVPEGCRSIDAAELYIMPGLIEPHCQVGLIEHGTGLMGIDSDETSDALAVDCHALDGINMYDQSMTDFIESGITTAGIFPARSNLIGGVGTVLKLKSKIIDACVLVKDAGLKVSLCEKTKEKLSTRKNQSYTRMGNVAKIRQAFISAKELAKGGHLEKALKKEMPVVIECDKYVDIAAAIALGKAFDLDIRLVGLADYQLMAEKLEGIHCAIGPIMRYGETLETKRRNQGFKLQSMAHYSLSVTTNHPIVNGRYSMLQGGILVQSGVDPDRMIEMMTIEPARFLGIDTMTGSIEVGKDADLSIWTGNPLDFQSKVYMTVIEGQIIYERGMKNDCY